jgi:hypothetical protein
MILVYILFILSLNIPLIILDIYSFKKYGSEKNLLLKSRYFIFTNYIQ